MIFVWLLRPVVYYRTDTSLSRARTLLYILGFILVVSFTLSLSLSLSAHPVVSVAQLLPEGVALCSPPLHFLSHENLRRSFLSLYLAKRR